MPADKQEGLNACLCLLRKTLKNLAELGIRSAQHINHTLQLWNTLHIPPIWPRVTFFSSLRSNLSRKKKRFSDIDSIEMAATMELKKIPENAFQESSEESSEE